jgi:hypothetical protein
MPEGGFVVVKGLYLKAAFEWASVKSPDLHFSAVVSESKDNMNCHPLKLIYEHPSVLLQSWNV